MFGSFGGGRALGQVRTTMERAQCIQQSSKPTHGAGRWTLDAGRSALDPRPSTLDARRSTFDARRSTLDTYHVAA
ncbi:MAG: hypothetical protein ABGY24_16680 [bacterium]